MNDNALGTEWCDIVTAARYLAVSRSFLRKQVRARRIPFARAGKLLRFRRRDLDAWLMSNGYGGGPLEAAETSVGS